MNSRNILLSHALKEKAALTGLLLILLNFSGSLIAQSYCPANGSACDNHISNVALPSPLGGINRNSGCETGNYVDVTSFIVTMAVNTTYNGTISSNQGGYVCATVGIWVDWNNNFLFTDVGENVFLSGSWTGGNPLPISVTPPNGTTAGYKRMRIRSGSNCTGTMGPCGAFGTGEVEDYTVNVVTCTPAPGNPSAIAGAASVCSGSNQTYSVSAAANATGYTWTVPAGATFTGQNTTSVSVTFGSSSGTISVTSNNACGTSAPSTLAVTVNPLPVVNITPASATICSGSSQTLTASGATTYAWTPSSDLSSSSGATVTASPTITSTYTVTGTSSGCSGTQTVTVTVDAAPSPPTAASNSPVCTGNSLNLSAGTVAGATYSWTGPNGFTSTDQNPSIPNVTNAEVGTYSVSVMVNGCSSADATTTVIVDPPPAAPVASSNSPLCAGTTLNLTTDPVAGATYAWSGPNNFSSALQNPSISFVTPAESGTYSVTISVNGCTSLPGTVTVTVNAGSTPAITVNGPATFCAGDSVELIASAGNSYLWSNGLTSQAIWVSTTDSYSVAVDDGSGCPGISLPETITVNSLPSVSFTGLNSG
ncbi:MAG TPA: GEVED domain-containing protein, partial [Bacteroidia bacterium]|nr:GEVED domain-containing protein [Bacteroidia bacterium]